MNTMLIFVLVVGLFGFLTIIRGYLSLNKLTHGELKRYGMIVLLALVAFSIGGALYSATKLGFFSESIVLEYIFYNIYYLILLYATYTLYKISKKFDFKTNTLAMEQALKERRQKK